MARILILANSDLGLYKFRKELIEELLIGNEVYISLPNGGYIKDLVHLGCKFIETRIDRRGVNPIKDVKLLIHYLKIVSQIKPDQVITYTVKPNVYGGIVCRIKKIPYAVNITGLGTTFHNEGALKKIIVSLYKVACRNAKVLFFENEENRQIFIANNIVKEEKTCKLNGAGVSLEDYQFCDYPSDNNKIHLLFIGRVMREKGVDELFAVAKRIKDKYDNVVFDIVGPFEEDYENTVLELQKQGFIKYHGFQSDVKPFIEKAHCFVLPSYHEGMANTLLECGAIGRPLITSNIHGCKEAVINEGNGYLVNVGDSEDLYLRIKQFIDVSWDEKVEMGKVSRKIVENFFDKKIIVEKTIDRLFVRIN